MQPDPHPPHLAPAPTPRPAPPSREGPIIIGFIVAGLVIGGLARLLTGGRHHLSLPVTLGLGLAGSVIGGLIASLIGSGSIFELNVFGFILAVVAAVALIGVADNLAGKRTRSAAPASRRRR